MSTSRGTLFVLAGVVLLMHGALGAAALIWGCPR
jgi:hypothetical protein